jgi:hypothetical protein
MHCELIVPGLMPAGEYAAAALEGLRLPSLELLLARGRRTTDEPASLERWLAHAFGADDEEEIPAGALTLAASGGAAGEATWMRADPAHLKLNRDELILVPATAFGVAASDAEALTETLNRHFSGELTFYPINGERWCVRVDGIPSTGLRTKTPAEVAGRDINRHLPSGEGSMRWHGLLNEIQMLLHEHPANEAREARGEPVVNSVWLWGVGALPSGIAAPWQSVTADDALALGFSQTAGLRHRPLPANAGEWLGRQPEDGRHLLVPDTLRLPLALGDFEGWRMRIAELDERWLAPLVGALKSGRIGMVTLLVPDSSELRAFESTRNDLRHFWRRPKPLGAYLP